MQRGPERTCVGCRKARPQDELVRVSKRPDGTVTLDPPGRRGEGRGAYVCPEHTCIERAWATGGLRRALKDALVTDDLRARLMTDGRVTGG